MKEIDNIKELFSKGLENHASPVRPEVWNGLQAKMAAAGIASGSAAAAKGLSALAKWFIGGTAASVVTVGTVLLVNNSTEETVKETRIAATDKIADVPASPEKIETAQQTTAANSTGEADVTNNAATDLDVTQTQPENTVTDHLSHGNTRSWIWSEKTGSNVTGSSPEASSPAGSGAITTGSESAGEKPVDDKKEKPAADIGNEEPVPSKPASRSEIVLLPNIITPNNDGANDYYFIQSKYLNDFSIVIMNDKGDIMFRSADPDFKWDGTGMNGENAPDGNYVAIIIAKGEDGKYLKEQQPFLVKR